MKIDDRQIVSMAIAAVMEETDENINNLRVVSFKKVQKSDLEKYLDENQIWFKNISWEMRQMGKYRINLDGETYEMEIERIDGTTADSEGSISSAWQYGAQMNAANPNIQIITPTVTKRTVNESNIVHSPMPGTVIEILAKNGDAVKTGQTVLILEAMKMENEITAPRDGVVANLNIDEKQTVEGGIVLFEIVD